MATDQEKLNFYLPRDEAQALREVAREQRRTLTELLRHASRQIIADHKSNGSGDISPEKPARAATPKG